MWWQWFTALLRCGPWSSPSGLGDGISEDPPLRCESSHRLGSAEEDDCKIGEVGVRELKLVVSVRCGSERDMTRG